MQPLVIKKGDRFGQLTIIRELPAVRDGNRYRRVFRLKCDCGKTCAVKLIQLTTGSTRSCGCLFIAALSNKRTHGRSRDPIYYIWQAMRNRCQNPNFEGYENYGGRGIKVCKRWLKFENFLADIGDRPSPKHEISRLDNDGDYKPGNVEWSSDGVFQNRNRRKQKNASSQYRGVDWWNGRAWRARITIRGEMRELGLFDNEKDAARAYDAVASRYNGFRLNLPP